MIIKDVLIKNFFCYLNENRFKFDKGLNIISGRNGSGKSQFFNAFYWTFFDQVYSEDNASKKKKWISARNVAIYPQALAVSTGDGEQFTTAVEVIFDANDYTQPFFTTEDTMTYVFRREVTFSQTDRGLSAIIPSELSIEYIQDGETIILNRGEHDMVLDKIFPKSIRKFMWYQGETMDTLYDFSE
ncbi:MAG: AAA family ATPase, partial [Daejeonella sp.]